MILMVLLEPIYGCHICCVLAENVPRHTVVSLPYYPIHLKEKIKSKLIHKSKVVYLRCQKVHQYFKPYLKY